MDQKMGEDYNSIKNTELLSWLVLKDLLSVEWDSYNLFGFQITDTLIIQKLFGLLITLLIAQDISNSL